MRYVRYRRPQEAAGRLCDDGGRARASIQQAHLAEERAGPQRHSLLRGHLDARGAVEDEEELVAGVVRAGQHGAGRGIDDLCDPGDAPELPLAASLKNRDVLEPLDLVPLLDGGPGGDGFRSSLGIVGDSSVHHPEGLSADPI